MSRDLKELISQLTLEEKAGLCSGKDFWRTKAVERLGIPSIMMSDGPHGLRTQKEESDHLGLNDSIQSICFPSGATLASSWDVDLLKKVGETLGEESQAEKVDILLGPAVNIKRSPLCGRNFEYYSEDPFLSTELATSFINGVQSQGVGSSIKHYAANNQEFKRMSVNTQVEERTLREIYLASFEGAVKNAQPWTVMCAYNQVNGDFCSQNKKLLTDILKDEWGHEGLVVSDWGAVFEREKGIAAGMELEMPSSHGYGDHRIVQAVQNGKLAEADLDKAVERILKVVFKAVDSRKVGTTYDKKAHHLIAKEVAAECMVLLKNEDNILPLSKKAKIAVVGAFAKTPRYQGGGSSHINPTQVDQPIEAIQALVGSKVDITYAPGYAIENDDTDAILVYEAINNAKSADQVVLFIGLPDRYESEGYDRTHLLVPINQIALLHEIYSVQKNIVVVLCNGSPIEMPWLPMVKGLIEGYLGGQALGGAIAEILFGDVNPSGKLAETFPEKLSHNPSYLNFPGDQNRVTYNEGIFVGYRYYERKGIAPLFPFGFGLSYTNFEYVDIQLSDGEIKDTDTITVSVKVKNTGNVFGKEVIQLYVRDEVSAVNRPDQELKGFAKVALAPGEEKTVSFTLSKRAFAYYHVDLKDWHVETGMFEIRVGGSSNNTPLKAMVHVTSTVKLKVIIDQNSIIADFWDEPKAQAMIGKFKEVFQDDTGALGSDIVDILKGSVLRVLCMLNMITYEELDAFIEHLNS